MTVCIRREHSRWTTCGCDDCMVDRRRVAKRKRCGMLDRTPSEAAWAVLDEWVAAGFSSTWIASAAGIPARGIQSAVEEHRNTGRRRYFGHERAHAIVEADITAATVGTRDATGTQRRLRALAVNGWTCEALSEECGISFVTLASIRRGNSKQIRAPHWHTIRELYDRLEHTPGDSRDATRRALEHGWYAPAQWDDPETDPEPPRIVRRPHGSPSVLLENYDYLIGSGESHEQALKQLGVTPQAIERARYRAAERKSLDEALEDFAHLNLDRNLSLNRQFQIAAPHLGMTAAGLSRAYYRAKKAAA